MRWSATAWPRGLVEAVLGLTVAIGVLLGLTVQAPLALRDLETASLDLRFRLRGVKPPGPEVAIVLADDRSLAALGRWPFSRRVFAQAVSRLGAAGARGIAFDLLFSEPEQRVPAELRAILQAAAAALPAATDPAMRQALVRFAEDDSDAEFAAALHANGNVLLPLSFSFQGKTGDTPELPGQVYERLETSPHEPDFPLQPRNVVLPVPALAQAAAGLGHVVIAFDRDGQPRYDYLALPFSSDFVPSLPVRIAALYLGIPWGEVVLALGAGVSLGELVVPTDPAMRLAVNYRGPRGTIPTYSFADLAGGRLSPALFKDRIVLIGASFTGNPDSYPTPFGQTPMPGTERLATIVDMILARDFIRESPPPWGLIVIGVAAALAVLTGVAAAFLPTRLAVLAGAVPLLVWAIGSHIAFLRGLWLPLVHPSLALALSGSVALLYRYGFVDRQRRAIHNAFRHYLAPDLVNALAAHPEQLQLGGETRTITIMFSDIRGFTAISESFKANPQGLSRLINRGFLTPMTKLIMARRGTIDKYMGDCVMAFWNAPVDDAEHAEHACGAALAMIQELGDINRQLAAEALAENREFVPIAIGVGLNTGDCVVGNMGSDERFAYTAMGDAVNLASRLEGQSKTYGVSIVVGEATRDAAPSWAALELDRIAVKGKTEPVRIFTLLGDAAYAESDAFRALAASHAAMLRYYRAQEWDAALAALYGCRCRDARLVGLYDLYRERIAHFRAAPPGPDWEGVFVAETK